MITSEVRSYGSFQDSLRAPIHRWFTYPAGYSHKLIEAKVKQNGLTPSQWIADPFLGTGTTAVTAKVLGVNSLGIEAHPFVYVVASTKLHFDYDLHSLSHDVHEVLSAAMSMKELDVTGVWPALIYKCFSSDNLEQVRTLRT
ncbi:MAG: hypothetical protein HYX93_03680 [Chloroflexi bacterium]|nr:hypothetical protein [Chloroflexota bacterium]